MKFFISFFCVVFLTQNSFAQNLTFFENILKMSSGFYPLFNSTINSTITSQLTTISSTTTASTITTITTTSAAPLHYNYHLDLHNYYNYLYFTV